MITSYSRGHKIYFNKGKWFYLEDDLEIKEDKPCIKCGKPPTKEGYDACLNNIRNATSACCGHGIEKGYVIYNGRA